MSLHPSFRPAALNPVAAAALAAMTLSAAPASALSPLQVWATPEGRTCIDKWISTVTLLLNRHPGDANFNAGKPWRINRYGLLMNRLSRSNYAPDDWTRYSSSKYHYMWGHSRSEAQYPGSGNAGQNRARIPGLRYFVYQCMAATGNSVTAGSGPGAAPARSCSSGPLDTSATCPGNFSAFGKTTLSISCYCPPAGKAGSIWGSGIYTADSNLCTAARHAGAIGPRGGMVTVKGAPGRSKYDGFARNGQTSSSYGGFAWSYYFPAVGYSARRTQTPSVPDCPANATALRGTGKTLTCHCAPNRFTGSVWGNGVYTDDSALCHAALHAGAITRAGGTIRAIMQPGRTSYTGSTRFGVSSKSFGKWSGSYLFAR